MEYLRVYKDWVQTDSIQVDTNIILDRSNMGLKPISLYVSVFGKQCLSLSQRRTTGSKMRMRAFHYIVTNNIKGVPTSDTTVGQLFFL